MQKHEKTLFLVTSALNVPSKNMEEKLRARLHDTLSTINSINCHFKDCEIWLLESSFKKPMKKYLSMFPKNLKIVDFWSDDKILGFHSKAMKYEAKNKLRYYTPGKEDLDDSFLYLGYVKNRTESYVLSKVFREMDMSKFDRVFKLSGRYCLQPTFDVKPHLTEDAAVFGEKIKSNQGTIKNIDYIYLCYLWSFPIKIKKEITEMIVNVEKEVKDYLKENRIIDMEHSIYNNLRNIKVKELKKLQTYAKINAELHSFF